MLSTLDVQNILRNCRTAPLGPEFSKNIAAARILRKMNFPLEIKDFATWKKACAQSYPQNLFRTAGSG
jgi:hypothetical protein